MPSESNVITRAGSLGVALSLAALSIGCGPSHVAIEPADVADLRVRPASGQLLFCPGDPFLVEIVARMKDGSACSSSDTSTVCMGGTNNLIDPKQVHLEGSPGRIGDQPLVWVTDRDPLPTAATGLKLKAWLETIETGAKSSEGEAVIKPVYDCQMEGSFTPPGGAPPGGNGVVGPDVTVAVTSLSTPFYPDAALVRVESNGQRYYYISSSADRQVKIISRGQAGGSGSAGVPGNPGTPGANAAADAAVCTPGGDGGPGTDGGPGGVGGEGGAGGKFRLLLDERVADKLRGRVVLMSVGGDPGPAGPAGAPGPGGAGGAGGQPSPSCQDTTGKRGADGKPGTMGTPGKRGADGVAPEPEAQPRASLFSSEATLIEQIESTKAH